MGDTVSYRQKQINSITNKHKTNKRHFLVIVVGPYTIPIFLNDERHHLKMCEFVIDNPWKGEINCQKWWKRKEA